MIVLVLTYCLAGNAKQCHDKRLGMEGFQTPAACVSSAQQRAIEYLRDHPQYVLKRWRCEINVPKQVGT
ncbi:MAG: hypothetical protein POG24_06170 [Acidocella sp.]|nr:hypothetical protein [Acidocella sp.]